MANMAAGEKKGFAQSIYQVGGNFGQSMAPIFTTLLSLPLGQRGVLAFSAFAFWGMVLLIFVSFWYKKHQHKALHKVIKDSSRSIVIHHKIRMAMLIVIVFARSWYSSCISNFYQFYLIKNYGLSIAGAQIHVFIFMITAVIGTFCSGPLADHFGKRTVIFASFLGAAPLTLFLPHVPIYFVGPIFLLIGFIITSSFSVSVVYGQELVPESLGPVSGLITGIAFEMGAIGAVLCWHAGGLVQHSFRDDFVQLFPTRLAY